MDPMTLTAIGLLISALGGVGLGTASLIGASQDRKKAKKEAEKAKLEADAEKARNREAYERVMKWLREEGGRPFRYDPDNPELNALRALTRNKYEDTAAALAAGLAARGITDSGTAVRTKARLGQAEAADIQRLTAEDIARQYSRFVGENERMFRRLMAENQIADSAYRSALDNYWRQLALEQEAATRQLQSIQGIISGLGAGLGGLGSLYGGDPRFGRLYPYSAADGAAVNYRTPVGSPHYGWDEIGKGFAE